MNIRPIPASLAVFIGDSTFLLPLRALIVNASLLRLPRISVDSCSTDMECTRAPVPGLASIRGTTRCATCCTPCVAKWDGAALVQLAPAVSEGAPNQARTDLLVMTSTGQRLAIDVRMMDTPLVESASFIAVAWRCAAQVPSLRPTPTCW